jgi:hypothetical protein
VLPVVVTVSTEVADTRATDWLARSAAGLPGACADVVQVAVRAGAPRPSRGSWHEVRLVAVVFVRAADPVSARARVAALMADLSTAAYGPSAWLAVGLPCPDVVQELIVRRDRATSPSPVDDLEVGGWGRVEALFDRSAVAASRSGHVMAVPAKALPVDAMGSPIWHQPGEPPPGHTKGTHS